MVKVTICISVFLSGGSDLKSRSRTLYVYFYLRLFGFIHFKEGGNLLAFPSPGCPQLELQLLPSTT